MKLEKDLEAYCCTGARELGILSYKFVSPAHRAVPDRVFVARGQVLFVEFKSARGRLTSGQERELARLRQHGALVAVCRTFEEFFDASAPLRLEGLSGARGAVPAGPPAGDAVAGHGFG